MNKLNELLQKLCPDGLEYIKIGEVVDYEQPSKYIVESTDYSDIFDVPVLTAGQTFVLGYTNEKNGIYNASKESPVIIFDDFTGAFKWVDFPFKVKSSAMKILTVGDQRTFLRYIYHVMGHIGYSSTEHKRLWIGIYSEIKIPLPPMPVQEEIVRILDNFTALTAELTTELTARKQQYEHYRDTLLTFDIDSASWVELNDVIYSLNTGLNPRQFFCLNTEDAANYYVTIREIRGGRIVPTDKTDRINDEALALCNNRSNLEIGDVLFSGTGTIGETAVIMEEPRNWNIKEGVYAIKPNQEIILPKYLRYLLTATYIKTAYMKKVAGGTVKSIPMGEMRKLQIPVPPINEQERIVATLDRFDALCNDLSAGLPAEIEARQKQYEYYRDKLLTFEEHKENAG